MSWEGQVINIVEGADPKTAYRLAGRLSTLLDGITNVQDAIANLSSMTLDDGHMANGPAADSADPHQHAHPTMHWVRGDGWTGSGGDAYREHLADITKALDDFGNRITTVNSAVNRCADDLSTAYATLPVAVYDENELAGGTVANQAVGTGKSDGVDFREKLAQDHRKSPQWYKDGGFLDRARHPNGDGQGEVGRATTKGIVTYENNKALYAKTQSWHDQNSRIANAAAAKLDSSYTDNARPATLADPAYRMPHSSQHGYRTGSDSQQPGREVSRPARETAEEPVWTAHIYRIRGARAHTSLAQETRLPVRPAITTQTTLPTTLRPTLA